MLKLKYFFGMRKKVVLITGTSSGIGRELVLEFARNKYKVWATSRNVTKFSKLRKTIKSQKFAVDILKLDLNNKSSIDRAVKKIIKKDKRIDILINNAGYGMVGTVEETPIFALRGLFETNFFGPFYLTQTILPYMRKKRSGVIVNIGSIAGRYGFSGMSGYGATKWALEAFSESLYLEVKKFGIKVILFELGQVKTNFFKNRVEIWKDLKTTAYKFVYLKHKKRNGLFNLSISSKSAAKQIFECVDDEDPPLRQTLGFDAYLMVKARNLLPERLFLWMIRPKTGNY